MIRLVYSEDYAVNIGTHVFPTTKYNRIKERLLSGSLFRKRMEFICPGPADDEDLLMVHTRQYLNKLKKGEMSTEDLMRLELPYSKELVRASLICCQGTKLAVDIAIRERIGIHIGGGFHHAFPDHGEGFCVLNDIAVGIRSAFKRQEAARAIVIDCDLHQGNGTAAIFSNDPGVYTFSIHQEDNYPFVKPRSRMDIGLPDKAGDEEYLKALHDNIPGIMDIFAPDIMIYVAGADPYEEDQIGGLSLTREGLKRRDLFIFEQAFKRAVPVAVVLAGGYARKLEDTVDIHYNTIESGLGIFHAN